MSRLLLTLVFAASSVLPSYATDGTCTRLNLVFVIDESQSVGIDSYNDLKHFLISIATYLNGGSKNLISPDNIRLALVRFSTDAAVEYDLNTLTSLQKWKSNVTALPWMNGLSRNTGKALELVKTNVFTTANGFTREVSTAIILVTDGIWNVGPDPVPIARVLIQEFHAKILSVGVGNDIDFGKLRDISGQSDNVLNVTEYDKLETLTETLVNLACHIDSCSGDIAFLIETSEIIAESGFNEMKNHVVNMTADLNVGFWKTHIAVVHFSNQSGVLLNFFQGQSLPDIEEGTMSMHWENVKGLSDLGGGLRMVTDNIFTSAGGERSLAPSILIVFATGYWDKDKSNFLDPVPIAKALRDSGVTIYAVRIPVGASSPEEAFATSPCETNACNQTLIDITGSKDRFYGHFDKYKVATSISDQLCPSKSDQDHLKDMAGKPVDQNNVTDVLNDLNHTVGGIDNDMDSKDIYHTAVMLQKIAAVPKLSDEDFALYLDTVDQTLQANQTEFDQSAARHDSSNSILSSFNLLNEHLTASESVYLNGTNLGYTVTSVNCSGKSQTGLADTESGFEQGFNGQYFQSVVHAGIQLDHQMLCDTNVHKVVFAVYRNQKLFNTVTTDDDVTNNTVFSSGTAFSEEETKTPLPCTVVQNEPASERAVSASLVTNRLRAADTQEKISVSVHFAVPFDKVGLHGKLNTGFWNGKEWDYSGCTVDAYSDDKFTGSCSHLTDFTVLVDTTSKDPALCDAGLRIIGYTLSSCSLVCLALLLLNSLLGLLLLKLNWDLTNNVIGRFLMVSGKTGDLIGRSHLGSLFLFFFIFILFMDRQILSLDEAGCKLMAIVNYDILLMVICWTVFQAFNTVGKFYVLSSLGKVLKVITRPFVAVPFCIAFPMLLTVIAVVSVNDFFDRSDYFCWVRPDYIVPAVVVPFCFLIVGDLLAVAVLVPQLLLERKSAVRSESQAEDDKPPKIIIRTIRSTEAGKAEFNRNMIVIFSIQVVLGLPWILQCFTLGSPHLRAGNYLFTVFNASQGVLIAMFYMYNRNIKSKAMRSSGPTTNTSELSNRNSAEPSPPPSTTASLPAAQRNKHKPLVVATISAPAKNVSQAEKKESVAVELKVRHQQRSVVMTKKVSTLTVHRRTQQSSTMTAQTVVQDASSTSEVFNYPPEADNFRIAEVELMHRSVLPPAEDSRLQISELDSDVSEEDVSSPAWQPSAELTFPSSEDQSLKSRFPEALEQLPATVSPQFADRQEGDPNTEETLPEDLTDSKNTIDSFNEKQKQDSSNVFEKLGNSKSSSGEVELVGKNQDNDVGRTTTLSIVSLD